MFRLCRIAFAHLLCSHHAPLTAAPRLLADVRTLVRSISASCQDTSVTQPLPRFLMQPRRWRGRRGSPALKTQIPNF